MKSLILSAGAFVAFAGGVALNAEGSTFPNADGSGNIMSSAAWGGSAVPTDSIAVGSGTYFFDPVGTIGGLSSAADTAVVFDQAKSSQADSLMTITGRICPGNGATMRFTGGAYTADGSKGVFTSENGAMIEVTDGAQFKYTGGCQFGNGSSSHDNVFRVSGVGTKFESGTFYFSGYSAGRDNTLEICDGATVEFSTFYFYDGQGDGVVVSNASLLISNWYLRDGKNDYIHVKGDRPKVQLSAASKQFNKALRQGFRLIYDIPEQGYAYEGDTNSDCPIYSLSKGTDTVDDTTTLTLNGIPEYRAYLKSQGIESKRFRIFYCDSGIYDGGISDKLVAKWNETMPEGAWLECPSRYNGSSSADQTKYGLGRTVLLTVTAPVSVAAIDDVKFEKVEDAVAAAQDGETITLLRSVSYDTEVTLDGGDTAATKKSVTLDLAGFTFEASKASGYGLVVKGVNLTVTGDPTDGQGLLFKRLRAEGVGTELHFGRDATSQVGGYAGSQVDRLIEAADGAKVYPGYKVLTLGGDAASHGNVVRAVGEGSLVQLRQTQLLWSGSYANMIETLDGGTVTCSWYDFEGKENGLVCSNGCLRIQQYSRMGDDNFARVSGDHPELVLSEEGSSQGHKLKGRFKLTIDLPATGYDYGDRAVVPVCGVSANSESDGTMSIALTGMTDYVMHFVEQKVWRHGMRLVSLKNAGFTQEMVDAWNEPLADTGVTLVFVNSENIDLAYKVPREYAPGFMLTIR